VHEVLKHVDADYALIEGFKSYTGSIAKLLFVHTPRDLAELDDQVAVAYTGVSSRDGWSTCIPFLPPSSGDDDLADFVEQHASDPQSPASR
jgi:hypothetical protein